MDATSPSHPMRWRQSTSPLLPGLPHSASAKKTPSGSSRAKKTLSDSGKSAAAAEKESPQRYNLRMQHEQASASPLLPGLPHSVSAKKTPSVSPRDKKTLSSSSKSAAAAEKESRWRYNLRMQHEQASASPLLPDLPHSASAKKTPSGSSRDKKNLSGSGKSGAAEKESQRRYNLRMQHEQASASPLLPGLPHSVSAKKTPSGSSRDKKTLSGSGKSAAAAENESQWRYNLRMQHEQAVRIDTFSTRFSLPIFLKRVARLSSQQRAAIERVGFGSLLQLQPCKTAKTLMCELMERWSPERRAFLLPYGEIAITPLDVGLIMGLRISGKPVILQDEFISNSRFGIPGRRNIQLKELESKLDELGETDHGVDFIVYFLLFTFATLLFPNPSQSVDGRYAPLLRNVDRINEYAWGLVLLDDVLSWMTRMKHERKEYIGGCLLLLQTWSYEHFDVARPDLRSNPLIFPRACRWESSDSKGIPRDTIRKGFEKLNHDKITWELRPTAVELEIDIIKEFLDAQMNESQETSPQSGMANLPMDNDSNAEIDFLADNLEEVRILGRKNIIVSWNPLGMFYSKLEERK